MVRPYYNYDRLRNSKPRMSDTQIGGRMTPVVKLLLFSNIVVYILQLSLGMGFTRSFGLSQQGGVVVTAMRLFTYMFLHSPDHLFHIFTNMLGLYLLGPDVERGMGSRQFFTMYLISGVLGGAGWLLLGGGGLCIGASGAIMGVVASFAALYPRRHLVLIFFPFFPIKAWILVLAFAGLELLMYLSRPGSTIAHTVHLSGGIAGCFYTLAVFRPNLLHTRWLAAKLRPKSKSAAGPASPTMTPSELDSILDKISRDGISSLTAHERKLLENASRQHQRRQ